MNVKLLTNYRLEVSIEFLSKFWVSCYSRRRYFWEHKKYEELENCFHVEIPLMIVQISTKHKF